MAKKKKKQRTQIPEEFFERLKKICQTPTLFTQVSKTFTERPTTFRANTIKTTPEKVKEILNQNGFKVTQPTWYKDAFILQNKSKKDLMNLDIYENGEIYIQSLASMVPPVVLEPQPGEKVLDLTAAPGSKTSQIAAMMNLEGNFTANDVNKVRFFKLQHNLENLGAGDFVKLRMEHGASLCREFEDETFDKILLDAPCSAETRFNQEVVKSFLYWNKHKIKDMAYKQRQLILSAWPKLKKGGVLVYSTCTFAPEENELQVQKLMQRFPGEVKIEPINLDGLKPMPSLKSWNDKDIDPAIADTLRIMPTKEVEGFYIAKLIKND